jgi:hypothetical protein
MTDQELKDLVASLAVDRKETDRQLKELKDNLDKLGVQVGGVNDNIGKLGVQVGGINDNIGFHAEQYFQDILMEKLTFGGQKYDRMIPNLECFGKKLLTFH